MAVRIIKDEDSKVIRKTIKKFSKKDVASYNERLRGSFSIVGYRKYHFRNEVDIEFNGELFATVNSLVGPTWLKSEIYYQKGISKIKVNKVIKRLLFREIKEHAAYFGIEIRFIEDVKKLKWV